jgi:hypothetical protein
MRDSRAMSLRISSLLNYTAGGISFADLFRRQIRLVCASIVLYDITTWQGNIDGKLAFGIDT